MSEYSYLTGRKELFDEAPPEAMVVLETNDGQLYYAVSHNRGAKYWYSNGHPGRPIGLIALFEKTRVIASRALIGGLPPVKPKRDPIPKSRFDRMQQAQNSIKKAVGKPAQVKPKAEPVKLESPVITPKVKPERIVSQAHTSPCQVCGITGLHACPGKRSEGKTWTAHDKQRLKDAVEQVRKDESNADGFVSIFALGSTPRIGETFITLNRNGNISMSSRLPFAVGDQLDFQLDMKRGLIRVGKVKTGGRVLPKSRMVTCGAMTKLAKIPEGVMSVRIQLTEADGWWQGRIELAKVPA